MENGVVVEGVEDEGEAGGWGEDEGCRLEGGGCRTPEVCRLVGDAGRIGDRGPRDTGMSGLRLLALHLGMRNLAMLGEEEEVTDMDTVVVEGKAMAVDRRSRDQYTLAPQQLRQGATTRDTPTGRGRDTDTGLDRDTAQAADLGVAPVALYAPDPSGSGLHLRLRRGRWILRLRRGMVAVDRDRDRVDRLSRSHFMSLYDLSQYNRDRETTDCKTPLERTLTALSLCLARLRPCPSRSCSSPSPLWIVYSAMT